MYWIALTCGVVATVFFLVVRVKKAGVPGLLSKSIPSFFFIATACAALAANSGQYHYGLLIIPGLVFGLLGDICLDLKWIYPKDKDAYLYAGFYSFFTGHLFYLAAIYLHFNWTFFIIAVVSVAAFAGAAVSILLEKILKVNYGKFKTTGFIYAFILMFMTFSSIAAAVVTGGTVWILMSAGGILFLASDLVLSGMYFGEGKNTPVNVVINHGLYYSAQFFIASSILFMY